MDLYVMNRSREVIGIIDDSTSVLWVPRFIKTGDFEIYIKATPKNIGLLAEDNYIYRIEDKMVVVIEHVKLSTDEELGNYLLVTGKDVKSLLGRRIVWSQTILTGTAESALRRLITENVINPSKATRKINGIVLGELHGFTEKIEKQVTGDNLLKTIIDICESFNYGFEVTMNENREFVCNFYKGIDRSENQREVPWVTFSPEFDNLSTSEYERNKSEYKNTALVAGEGEGLDRKVIAVNDYSDIDRYEVYIDARDLSTNGEEITQEEYNSQLNQRGKEVIAENKIIEVFSGEVITGQTYEYGVDYFLGDIVTVENEYGIRGNVQITEVIENMDDTGHKIIPTFENWRIVE